MKFLLFNLAVAAALGYLFFADRGQVQDTAGRMHDAARDLRMYARQAYDKAPQLVQGLAPTSKAVPAARDAVAAEPKSVAQPPNPPVVAGEPAPNPSVGGTNDVPSPPPTASRTPETAGKRPIQLVPDPAIVARRREVMEGRPPREANPALHPGARLMSPGERHKELMTLAEEMDLFYARSVSR